MVTVFFGGMDISDADISYQAIEFPESPKIGDYIDLQEMPQIGEPKSLEDFLKERNKIRIGYVNGRTWDFIGGKVMLFCSMAFHDLEEQPTLNEGFFR